MPLTNSFFYPTFVADTPRRLAHGEPAIADLADMVAAMDLVEATYAAFPLTPRAPAPAGRPRYTHTGSRCRTRPASAPTSTGSETACPVACFNLTCGHAVGGELRAVLRLQSKSCEMSGAGSGVEGGQ